MFQLTTEGGRSHAITNCDRIWSFYIWQGFAPIVGQADPEGVPPANRALDHAQSQGFFAKAALTGLCSAWQSRKRGRRFSKAGAGASTGGRRIDNPPDPGVP